MSPTRISVIIQEKSLVDLLGGDESSTSLVDYSKKLIELNDISVLSDVCGNINV